MDFLTTQTGYEFVYRKGVLNTGEKVTLELKDPGGGDGPERWLSFGTSCR